MSRRRFLLGVTAGGACAGLASVICAFAQASTTGAAGNPIAYGRPSDTAQGAAVLRAAHQLLDVPRI